ncbi:MAG: tRNA 2-selenouridine(34) synthase MnmH [Pseudomonadota bacterium]
MIKEIAPEEFLELRQHLPVIDVRSPGEFILGHIPNAHNVYLFNDEERAQVGTKYKQAGREPAVFLGLELIGPQIAAKILQAKNISNKELLIHCWRGGMRSQSMAWAFNLIGIDCHVLLGGYKAYRAHIRQSFEKKALIVILGGMTGTGKSEYLRALNERGFQALDLEKLANHKGSSFGAIGQAQQPSNEQFENDLFDHWQQVDFSCPLLIEDESQAIGKVGIPNPLYLQMRSAPVIKLEISREERIKRLVAEYATTELQSLKDAVYRIKDKLGGLSTKMAQDAIDAKDFSTATDLLLNYYDKTYEHGLSKRRSPVSPLLLNDVRTDKRLDRIADMIEDLFSDTVGP